MKKLILVGIIIIMFILGLSYYLKTSNEHKNNNSITVDKIKRSKIITNNKNKDYYVPFSKYDTRIEDIEKDSSKYKIHYDSSIQYNGEDLDESVMKFTSDTTQFNIIYSLLKQYSNINNFEIKEIKFINTDFVDGMWEHEFFADKTIRIVETYTYEKELGYIKESTDEN